MVAGAWVALGGVVLALVIQAAGLVIWGARLTQRVKTLEAEVEPLKQLLIQFARMEVKQDGMLDQLKDLNASLRWMKQPADYDPRDLTRQGGR